MPIPFPRHYITTATHSFFQSTSTLLILSSLVLGGCTPSAQAPAIDADDSAANSPTLSTSTTPHSTPDSSATHQTTTEPSESATEANNDTEYSPTDSSDLFIAEDHLDAFVRQYFRLINQQQYQQAWATLSPEMQTSQSYEDYTEWWGSVRQVEIQALNSVYAGELGGELMVLVSYDKTNGGAAREVLVMNIGPLSEARADLAKGWFVRSVAIAKAVMPTQTQNSTPLTSESSLVIDGIGSVRVGMTTQEAANATGVPLATRGVYSGEGCNYYQAIGAPDGLSFMVNYDRIVRVDINTVHIKTPSGAGIGSSADEIKALYSGKIEESPHKYVNGQYLTFVPEDEADQPYRILFETDEQGQVTRFRSGFAENIQLVEGCS